MIPSKPDDLPLVTAIVGCYNHAKYVETALESVRGQTYSNIELIVFDDCSTDESVNRIRHWIERTGHPCTFLPHAKNMGICRSFNDALAHAKGKYIAVLAADDAWLPQKTETLVGVLEQCTEDVAVAFSDAYLMDARGERIPGTFIKNHCKRSRPLPESDFFTELWSENFIPAMATLIRFDRMRDVGIYDEDLAFEDWDMWLRLSVRFRFVFSACPTALYRILPSSMSHSRKAEMDVSTTLMRAKLAASDCLPRSMSRVGATFITDAAENMYRSRRPGRHLMLRKALRLHASKRALFMLLCSGCGLSYEAYAAVRGVWRQTPFFNRPHTHGAPTEAKAAD